MKINLWWVFFLMLLFLMFFFNVENKGIMDLLANPVVSKNKHESLLLQRVVNDFFIIGGNSLISFVCMSFVTKPFPKSFLFNCIVIVVCLFSSACVLLGFGGWVYFGNKTIYGTTEEQLFSLIHNTNFLKTMTAYCCTFWVIPILYELLSSESSSL